MSKNKLDRSLGIPLYYQLRTIIKDQISSGVFAPGAQLPSEMELCDQYEVSRPTLRKATDVLVEEGLLVRKRPTGTFVAKSIHQIHDESHDSHKETSDKPEEDNGGTQIKEKKTIKLSIEESMQDPFFFQALTEFEHKTGIKVIVSHTGDWNEGMCSFVNLALEKQMPDIFLISNAVVPMFAKYGLLLPLDDLIPQKQLEDIRNHPSISKYGIYTYENKLYAYPFFSETRLLYYRKDHLAELGIFDLAKLDLTHDSFLDLCQKLTQPQKKRWGFSSPAGYDGDTLQTMMQFIIQRGGYLYKAGAKGLEAGTDSLEFREAFSWYCNLRLEHSVCPPTPLYPSYHDIIAGFTNGNISMMVERPTVAMILRDRMDMEGKWGITNLPRGPKNNFNFLGGIPFCISSQCRNPDDAWALISFLTSKNFLFPYTKRIGFFPAIELFDSQEIIDWMPDVYKPFVEGMDNAVPFSYPFPQNVLGAELEAWQMPIQQVYRKVLTGALNIDDAIQHITLVISSLLKKYK